MIWEFYKTEKKDGTKASASDIVRTGLNRNFVFCNSPRKQRRAHCQKCGTIIPREVPRIKLDASYHYGAGYYCLSCGIKVLEEKKQEYEAMRGRCSIEIGNLETLLEITDEVMANEFYAKKMALGKMLQVMEE